MDNHAQVIEIAQAALDQAMLGVVPLVMGLAGIVFGILLVIGVLRDMMR